MQGVSKDRPRATAPGTPHDFPQTFQADLALAVGAASGDDRIRRRLVDRLYDRVRTTVYYLVCGHSGAEDFVQISMGEILRYLGSYRGQSSLETWADRIAVRTTLREVKRERRSGGTVSLEAAQMPEVTDWLEDDLYARQIRERIGFHLSKLKPKYKEAITYHLVLGYTVRETAEATNTNLDTMRNRLKVARKKFRKAMQGDSVLAEWADKGEP